MMNPIGLSLLDDIAAAAIPEETSIMTALMEKIEFVTPQPARSRSPRLAFTAFSVVIGLALLTTIVYAIYHYILDPGLKQAQDAGLLVDIDQTALPTLRTYPTITPVFHTTAAAIGESQELQGVKLTLEKAYADMHRVGMFFTTSPIPSGFTLGAPKLTFLNTTPQERYGIAQSFRNDQNQWIYSQFLVIQEDMDKKLDVDISVPMQKISEQPEWETVAEFHFSVRDLPLNAGGFGGTQTHEVNVNGVKARLKDVSVTPSFTELTLCYDYPSNSDAPFWYLADVKLQAGVGQAEGYRTYRYLDQITDDHCARLGFPVGAGPDTQLLTLNLNRMVVPLTTQDEVSSERIAAANARLAEFGIEIAPAKASESEGPGGWKFVKNPGFGTTPESDPRTRVIHALEESLSGPWRFDIRPPIWSDRKAQVTPTPHPLEKQTINNVHVTLDWAFVDAKRASVGFTITGLPNVPEAEVLIGSAALYDQRTGAMIENHQGSQQLERDQQQPGVIHGVHSWVFLQPPTEGQVAYRFELNLGVDSGTGENLGWFPIPTSEVTPTPPPMGYTPPRLPAETIGTFSFNFTAPVAPLQKIGRQPVVEANGVPMWIDSAEVSPSFTSIVICYDKPEPADKDWGIYDITLSHEGKEVRSEGFGLVYDKNYPKGQPLPADHPVKALANGRCYSMNFVIGSAGSDKQLTFTVKALEQSMPERIPDEALKAALEKLKAQGIDMSWSITTYTGGGGGAGPIYNSLPAGMTQEQAMSHFIEALGYTHPGPWVMTITLP